MKKYEKPEVEQVCFTTEEDLLLDVGGDGGGMGVTSGEYDW